MVTAWLPATEAVVDDKWVDAEVRATGVLEEGKRRFWIADIGGLKRTGAAPPPWGLPETQIGLLGVHGYVLPAHRVRVRGMPFVSAQGGLAVRDESGQIPVRLDGIVPDPNTRALDLAGFVERENGKPVLTGAIPSGAFESEAPDRAPSAGATITTAVAVHRLALGDAQRAHPVHLRAAVTYFDAFNHILFVQDRTGGIFVEINAGEKVSPRPGDDVEVWGVTTADFAPDVVKARVVVSGHSGLPPARRGRFGGANWGREDCRWVEFEGVVRRVAEGWGDSVLTLSWGKTVYKAHVLARAEALAHLVDADVAVRGVCGALFNSKRQMLGVQMYVPGAECIRMVHGPPPDPLRGPVIAISELMQFSGRYDIGHRVHVRGTVTCAQRAGSMWIRDATGGVMIREAGGGGAALGDLVDVAGFAEMVGTSPVLSEAQVKWAGTGKRPEAVEVTAENALKGGLDGQLVRIDGTLADRLQEHEELTLAVESGKVIFNANLIGSGAVPRLEAGMRLRLTGIFTVETQEAQDLVLPRTFRLLLRTPGDIAIVGGPPLVTARRVVPTLGGAALLVFTVVAWAGLLRRQVARQTLALRAQTVQLQAAHQRTRNALRKACEAEALDHDSKRILEMIARDEPMEHILEHIAEAAELHCEGAACVILLSTRHVARVWTVPTMPPAWQQALERVELRTIAFSAVPAAPKSFSGDPMWEEFIDSRTNPRFSAVCSAAILVDGAVDGAMVTFFRAETPEGDIRAQLSLWSNVAALALDRRRLHDQLSHRAQHDGLTGLPNRALLYERLEGEIEQAARGGSLMGLLYLDLDGFKQVNDTYGHDAGDAVLREVARRLTHGVRRGDTVARIGGDEFVVLLPLLSRPEDATQVAHKLAAALAEPIHANRERYQVSASVGVAIYPPDGTRADPLLRHADTQMYCEKRKRWPENKQADLEAPPALKS